ncbi:DUF6088 family protein [Marinomonas epiphytica]
MATKTLKSKVNYRIIRSKSDVFTPSDFFDLSDRDQIGRALRQLVSEQRLIRFGQGLYAKTKVSKYTGKVLPVRPLTDLAVEALNKLNVKVVSSKEQTQYNQNQTTQVPTGRVIAVKGRVTRRMSLNGSTIKYQRVS